MRQFLSPCACLNYTNQVCCWRFYSPSSSSSSSSSPSSSISSSYLHGGSVVVRLIIGLTRNKKRLTWTKRERETCVTQLVSHLLSQSVSHLLVSSFAFNYGKTKSYNLLLLLQNLRRALVSLQASKQASKLASVINQKRGKERRARGTTYLRLFTDSFTHS